MTSELVRLAREALSSLDFGAFEAALASQQFPESFGILADEQLRQVIQDELGEPEPMKWLLRPLTWNVALYRPDLTLRASETLLHLLWQDLSTRLSRKLDAVANAATIARRGAVVCFFGRAQFSIVVEYTKSGGGAVKLTPLAGQLAPNGVLELATLFGVESPEVRNALKNAALSVDKLVFQRGTIVHVDRQREDVFGPTIDTVLLGELLAEYLIAMPESEKVDAIEIGTGSGLLAALLASSDRVRTLTAVDINRSAVACTLKNLHVNDVTLDAVHQEVRIRAERYVPEQLASRFDLLVCNPPYIPEPSGDASGQTQATAYQRAVAGLELCTCLLGSVPNVLTPGGVALLMVSSVSEKEVLSTVPTGWLASLAITEPGRRVPLDVDVVWRNSDWQDLLLREGRIERDSEGGLWHYLRPVWICRREDHER